MAPASSPDVVRPYVGYVRDFADSGFFQPWNPKLIPNLKHLNTAMVKAGQYKGQQWGIPQDWGFDKILYRTDKVKPKAQSWSLIFDDRYAGKIAWFDDLNQLVVAGYYLGFKKPYDQSDAELEQSQKFLVSKKHLARTFWSSETDMQNDFRRRRPLDRVRVAGRLGGDEGQGAEGRLHAPEGGRDLLDRDAHARQGHAAAAARARVRRRLELEADR